MTSAYPKTVDALMPDARRLAAELGRTPSRNQLMSNLRIGRDKARAVLTQLATGPGSGTESGPGSAAADPGAGLDPPGSVMPVPHAPAVDPAPRLHPVPDTRPDPATPDPGTQPGDPIDPVDPAAVVLTGQLPDPASTQLPTALAPEPNITTTTPAGAVARWQARWRRMSGTAPAAYPAPAGRPARTWPLVLLALPAFVAIWSGWVGLGVLTGFGPVHPLPGIAPGFTLNTAITLPIGVETYAAYALRVWLAGHGSTTARRFAKRSAIAALVLGAAGQVAYHLMTAQHVSAAPWEITTAVACLPVIVLGCGAALAHLQHTTDNPAAGSTPHPDADPPGGSVPARLNGR